MTLQKRKFLMAAIMEKACIRTRKMDKKRPLVPPTGETKGL
jgi:hypothetical protein